MAGSVQCTSSPSLCLVVRTSVHIFAAVEEADNTLPFPGHKDHLPLRHCSDQQDVTLPHRAQKSPKIRQGSPISSGMQNMWWRKLTTLSGRMQKWLHCIPVLHGFWHIRTKQHIEPRWRLSFRQCIIQLSNCHTHTYTPLITADPTPYWCWCKEFPWESKGILEGSERKGEQADWLGIETKMADCWLR